MTGFRTIRGRRLALAIALIAPLGMVVAGWWEVFDHLKVNGRVYQRLSQTASLVGLHLDGRSP